MTPQEFISYLIPITKQNIVIQDSILRDSYWRKLNCYGSPVK